MHAVTCLFSNFIIDEILIRSFIGKESKLNDRKDQATNVKTMLQVKKSSQPVQAHSFKLNIRVTHFLIPHHAKDSTPKFYVGNRPDITFPNPAL